ncbi:MAG: ABC transporter substrate-binding protein [Betaproteobacteria bacterium]
MRKSIFTMIAASVLALSTAQAEVTIGITLPLTGPASGIGIPMQNAFKIWPEVVGGEKIRMIVLDDATDPGKGASNARRFIAEDKVDLLIGSVATPVAASVAEVALDTKVPQLAMAPVALPAGRDAWTFRVPHSNGLMATAIVNHMLKSGVKTAGFLGYADAYGESWLIEAKARMDKAGIKLVGSERFARSDTAVTAQALKLASANPDAILIAASGSGAAMPHLAMIDRGFKGKLYQTHGAATRDLIRVGGKGVEGALVSSSPVVVADQLPTDHRLKQEGMRFIQVYEKAYGAGSRNALSAHAWDAYLILDKVIPAALKKARPGTIEFRNALRDALESVSGITITGGVLDYTSSDHWGYKDNDPIIMKVVNGDYKFDQ